MKVTWDINNTCTCTNYLYLIKRLKQPFPVAGCLMYTSCILLCSFMKKKNNTLSIFLLMLLLMLPILIQLLMTLLCYTLAYCMQSHLLFI